MTTVKSKKLLSILLSITMLLSSIFVGGMVASATSLDDLVSITNTYDDETTGSFAGLVQFNACTPLNDEPGTSLSTRSKTDEEFTLVEKKYVAVSGAQIAEESDGNKAVHFTLAKPSNWNAVVRIYDPNTAGLTHFMAEANKTYEIKFRYKVDSVPTDSLRIQLIRSKYSGEMHQGNYEYGGSSDSSGLERVLVPEIVYIDNVTNGWADAYITYTMPETSHYLTLGLASKSYVDADVWIDDVVVSECIKITAHNYNASADKAIPVSKNTTIADVEIPEVAGYRFCGIYADENYATKLDSTAQAGLYSDLYFKWEPLTLGEFYCGFEDYKPQTTAMSYDADVVYIGGGATYVGSKALKATMDAFGITAFELRNESAFEITAGTQYTVTFAYKADADVEIYAGLGKAGDVPGTAEALAGMEATGDGTWKTAELTFTADKGTADGYAIAMLLYTETEAEIFIDDVLVAGPAQNFANPEINTNFSEDWYPTLALFEGVELPDIWDGTVDTENTMSGSGTEEDPYQITNGNQLAYVIKNGGLYSIDSTSKYFEITNDIYLNSTSSVNWKTGEVASGASVNGWCCTWSWDSDLIQISEDFQGTIDGKGHTIYGVYVDKGIGNLTDGESYCTALIPRVNGATTIKNLGIDNSFIRSSYCTSAFIGYTSDTVTFENCYVGENAAVEGNRATTFLSMLAASKQITLKNCYSLASTTHHISANYYGMVSGCYHGLVDVYNCYNANGPIISYDHTTAGSSYSTIYKYYDSYRTEDKGYGGSRSVYGVTTITDTANMKGLDVFTNTDKMPNLNSDRAYIATEGYPVLAVHEGIEVPEIWGGSSDLSEPKDTDSDGVYEITNGAELAYVIKNNGMWSTTTDDDGNTIIDAATVKSFILTNDIYLNDVNMIDWSDGTVTNSAYTIRSWYTGWNGNSGFIGTIDGNGHTVYGLYLNASTSSTTQYSTGLIPLAADTVTVKNLGIDNSYLNYSTGGNTAAFVGARAEKIYDSCTISFENCFVGENTTLAGYRVAVFRGYQQYGDATTNITNCYSLANLSASSGAQGLVTTIWGTTTVKNTYTTSQVSTATSAVTASNVYEGIASGTTNSGITLLSNELDMKGMDVFTDSAKMPNLNADDVFVATEGYPQLKAFADEVATDTETDAEESEPVIWGGISDLSEPKDTNNDGVYEITNGAELAWAVKYNGKINDVAAKFILTSDIYLNEIDKVNWTTGALNEGYTKKQWYNSGTKGLTADGTETTLAFEGSIDGAGHIIFGLYYKTTSTNLAGGQYTTALLPTVADGANVSITNLGLDYSYIDYEGTAAAFVAKLGQTDTNASTTSLTIEGCYVGSNVKITGNFTAVFRGYCYGAATNITNSYSLATLVSKDGAVGLVSTAWGKVTIKNTYTTDAVSTNTGNNGKITASNVYEGVSSGYTISGVTTLTDLANMKGEDVLTNSSKMSGLASASAFIPSYLDFANHDYYIYLPEGTVFTEDFEPSFYDTFFMSADKDDILLANTMMSGAYVKFAKEPVAASIKVPTDLLSFVHQGTMEEIKAMDYQTKYYGIQSEIISNELDKQSADAVNYVFITDIHYNGEDTSTGQGAALLNQMKLVVEMANNDASIDFIAVGGDIIEGTTTKANAISYLQTILAPLKDSEKPVLIMPGNHDDNSYGSWSAYIGQTNYDLGYSDDSYFAADKLVGKYDWNESVIKEFVTPEIVQPTIKDETSGLDIPQSYYYYDLVKNGKTTRIFCFDAIDYAVASYNEDGSINELLLDDGKAADIETVVPTAGTDLQYRYKMGASEYTYSDAQIEWLKASLKAGGFDDVIFLSHMGIDSETLGVSTNGDKLRAVISDFNNKTGDLAETEGKILSYQFGHIHSERELYSADIDLWQICTSTAKAGQASKGQVAPWRSLTYSLETESEACFDIMSVSKTGIVKLNIGAGTDHSLVSYLKLPAGDVNTDETVDIRDLVKLSNVDKGEANKTTAADVNKDKLFSIVLDAEALRKLLIGA